MNRLRTLFDSLFCGVCAYICFAAFSAFGLSSCTGNKVKYVDSISAYPADSLISGKDTTLYGVAGECGMSTFCLVSGNGEQILVTRDNELGEYGSIYGDLNEGDSFSLSTRDNMETLAKAINITQMRSFPVNFSVFNGHLVVDGHVVEIKKMDKDSLLIQFSNGNLAGYTSKK